MMNTAAPETEVKARMTSSWIEDKHQEEEKWNRERKLIENPRKKTLTMESESSNPQNGAYYISKNLRHIQVKWNATNVYSICIYIYIHMKYDKKTARYSDFFDKKTSDRKLSDFKPQLSFIGPFRVRGCHRCQDEVGIPGAVCCLDLLLALCFPNWNHLPSFQAGTTTLTLFESNSELWKNPACGCTRIKFVFPYHDMYCLTFL